MAKNSMSMTSAITMANFDKFWFGKEFKILLDEKVMKCAVFQSYHTVGMLKSKEHWGLSFEWEDGTKVMYEGTKDGEATIMTSANLIPRCHLGDEQQPSYKRNIGKLENKSKKDVHEAAYKNPCNFTTYSEEHNSYHDWIKQFGESLGVIVSPPIRGRRKTVSNYAKQGAIVVATTAGIITGIRTLGALAVPHYSLIAKTASSAMIMMSCFFLVKGNPVSPPQVVIINNVVETPDVQCRQTMASPQLEAPKSEMPGKKHLSEKKKKVLEYAKLGGKVVAKTGGAVVVGVGMGALTGPAAPIVCPIIIAGLTKSIMKDLFFRKAKPAKTPDSSAGPDMHNQTQRHQQHPIRNNMVETPDTYDGKMASPQTKAKQGKRKKAKDIMRKTTSLASNLLKFASLAGKVMDVVPILWRLSYR